MGHSYYIIPTTENSFILVYTVDFGFMPKEYSKEFVLLENRDISIVVKKDLEQEAEEDLEKLDRNELSRKYKMVGRRECDKMREILRNKFVSSDRVFESVFKGELERFLRKTEKFKSNLDIDEKELESTKKYFREEIESVKETVISKVEKLVGESRFIKPSEKEELKRKIKRGIENLQINVVLANANTREYSSMAYADRIVIAHNEKNIRMVNSGNLEGFAENKDFQLTNKAVLLHEISHRVGDVFGWTFGESFAVRMQEECLKDLGLRLDEEKIALHQKEMEDTPKEGHEEGREDENQGGFKRFEDIIYFNLMENKERFSKLKSHYLKAQEGHENDKEAAILKMIGNREGTEGNLFEYGEVYLDRKFSLSEIFDTNAEKCMLNSGKEPKVHEVMAFENFFLDESIDYEHKGEILAHYLYKRDFSLLAIEKIRHHLFSRIETTPKNYLIAEKKEFMRIAKSKLDMFKSSIESVDAENKRGHIDYEEEYMVEAMIKLSHLLPAYESRRIIDGYYKTLKRKVGHEKMKKTKLFEHIESIEGGSKETPFNKTLFSYIKNKEDAINIPEEETNAEAASKLQMCEIVVAGKNDNEEFTMVYNPEFGLYEMHEASEGKNDKLPLRIKISNDTANAILEALEEDGRIEREEFWTKIVHPKELAKSVKIKSIREASKKENTSEKTSSPRNEPSRPRIS